MTLSSPRGAPAPVALPFAGYSSGSTCIGVNLGKLCTEKHLIRALGLTTLENTERRSSLPALTPAFRKEAVPDLRLRFKTFNPTAAGSYSGCKLITDWKPMPPCNLSRGVSEADLTLQSSDLAPGAGNGEVRVPKKISRSGKATGKPVFSGESAGLRRTLPGWPGEYNFFGILLVCCREPAQPV
jgi:hypothetical protein